MQDFLAFLAETFEYLKIVFSVIFLVVALLFLLRRVMLFSIIF